MRSFKARKMTKPIHILLTKEYLVVSVSLVRLLSGSSTLFSLVQDCGNCLKSWSALNPNAKKLLIVSLEDTPVGPLLRRLIFQRMRNVGTSLGWMVARSGSPDKIWGSDAISLCLATYKMVKLLS